MSIVDDAKGLLSDLEGLAKDLGLSGSGNREVDLTSLSGPLEMPLGKVRTESDFFTTTWFWKGSRVGRSQWNSNMAEIFWRLYSIGGGEVAEKIREVWKGAQPQQGDFDAISWNARVKVNGGNLWVPTKPLTSSERKSFFQWMLGLVGIKLA